MKKPTYRDIALVAGVGTATVERVLNGRGGVRPATADKVVIAARKLDWSGRLPEKHRGISRFKVILVRPETSFFRHLSSSFRTIASSLGSSVHLQLVFVDEVDPRGIALEIEKEPDAVSGFVVAVPDFPEVRAALREARKRDKPIVQIVTRSLPDVPFVGIDNYAVGRMAGLMLTRMAPPRGSIIGVCHSSIYPVHRDRIRGLSDFLAGQPDALTRFKRVDFGFDDAVKNAEQISALLEDVPDLAGIYSAGGGNRGILNVLRSSGRDVFFVGHELNDVTRDALNDGVAHVVFDQLPEMQAQRAIELLLVETGIIPTPTANPPIRFTTITRENL